VVTPALFFSDAGIVVEIHLRVKTTRQHAVVGVDQFICDANIVEPQAGQFGHKTIVLGVTRKMRVTQPN
jgi:hypothetical protein